MAIERLKSKVKEALMRYLLMKLFSQNLEILAPQNWVKKTQICISNTTGGKNIKIRNYNNFGWKSFFWYRNFKILKHRPLLWLHYWKTGQNLHLKYIFQHLEIAKGFDHWLNWLPYRKVTFKLPVFTEHH